MSFPFKAFRRDSSGAISIEYALVASLIAVAVAGVVWQIGEAVAQMYSTI